MVINFSKINQEAEMICLGSRLFDMPGRDARGADIASGRARPPLVSHRGIESIFENAENS